MLVLVCRFGVEVSRYATVVSQRDTDVKEGYVSGGVWAGEFNGGVNVDLLRDLCDVGFSRKIIAVQNIRPIRKRRIFSIQKYQNNN